MPWFQHRRVGPPSNWDSNDLDHILAFRIYDRICVRYWPGLIPSNEHFELVLLKFVVAGGLAVGAAYLSRRYFEERFLQLKDRLVPHTAAVAHTEFPNIAVDEPGVQTAF